MDRKEQHASAPHGPLWKFKKDEVDAWVKAGGADQLQSDGIRMYYPVTELLITAGDIFSGLEPSELAQIQKISPFGKKTLVEGVGVESLAMDVAMRYERSRGWTPYGVSKDGEHYDVRSELPMGEKRFIEVKGRTQSGAIILTGPELDKLRQLGDRAWLYIVTSCKGEHPRCARFKPNPETQSRDALQANTVHHPAADWSTQGDEFELGKEVSVKREEKEGNHA